MYQTVLRSVNGTTAVGANGENLEFIGNWPSQAGDTVWTDGKVIFGHISPKESSPLIFPNGGIPVSCEDSEGNDLKGYFTLNGTWKDYAVAPEDWIVNNEKLLYGGPLMYKDARVMDVEVTDEGDVYIATEGTFQFSTTMEYDNAIWLDANGNTITEEVTNILDEDYYIVWGKPLNIFGDREAISRVQKRARIDKSEKMILGNPDIETFSIPLKIYKNNVLQEEIYLEEYLESHIERIKTYFTKRWRAVVNKGEGYISSTNSFYSPPPFNGPMNYQESQENMKSLKIEAFKIDKNGKWEALISVAMFGYCFPAYEKQYVGQHHQKHVTLGGDARFVIDITNPSMGWVVDEDGEAETKEYDYPYNMKAKVWVPVLISTYALLKVQNGAADIVYLKSHGGTTFTINEERMYVGKYQTEIDFTTPDTTLEKDFTFGINEKYEMVFTNKKISIREKETGDLIETDLKLDIGQFAEFIYPYEVLNVDNGRWPGTKYMPQPRYKITDKDGAIEIDYHPKKGYEWLDGHYSHIDDEDDEDDEEKGEAKEGKEENFDDGLYRFNPCMMKLKNDKYLFGVHGGKLYIKTPSGIQEVGDGLKNFRLAELKNIAKAKTVNK